MTAERPGVLMVAGAYYPEVSGAGLQCRALVRQLRENVEFTVLTTTAHPARQVADTIDGVPVLRIFVDPSRWWSKAAGAVRFTLLFLKLRRRFAIVHLHGFSQKSMLFVWLALAGGKRIAIKLTSVGHDDPESMRRRGGLAYWCYTRAALFFVVSPRFVGAGDAAGIPPNRLRLIPNGVDVDRFRPAAPGERQRLRHELSFPSGGPVVLFVGFFSREKRPDVLFEAWARVATSVAPTAGLVFVGATRSTYYEIEHGLDEEIRARADSRGLRDRLLFVEETHEIERFYRAADILVLPSVREGLPNVVLEAMASGTPCIVSRLPGVTDSLIEDGRNGLLVSPDDVDALAEALRRLILNAPLLDRLGAAARRTIEERYTLDAVAGQYLAAYRQLLNPERCAA